MYWLSMYAVSFPELMSPSGFLGILSCEESSWEIAVASCLEGGCLGTQAIRQNSAGIYSSKIK